MISVSLFRWKIEWCWWEPETITWRRIFDEILNHRSVVRGLLTEMNYRFPHLLSLPLRGQHRDPGRGSSISPTQMGCQLRGDSPDGGTWVAQLVKHFGSGHDLAVDEFESRIGLCADSSEPGACFGFCGSLSLSLPLPCSCCVSQ